MLDLVKRNLAVVIVTAGVLGAGAVAWAQEAPPDPSAGAQVPATAPPEGAEPGPEKRAHARRHHKPVMEIAGRAIHGELIVRTGEDGFEELTFDKGVVRQEGDGYVLERPDGVKVAVKLTDSTRFRGIENASQIRAGAPAMVVSEKNGDARSFNQRPEGAEGRPGPEGRGFGGDRRNKPAPGSVAPSGEQVPAA